PIVCAILARDRELMLAPRLIEERDDAMMEQVQEIAQRAIALAQTILHEQRVCMRQHALRPREAEEVDAHAGRRVLADIELLDLAGRKRQARGRSEAHHFPTRIIELADV